MDEVARSSTKPSGRAPLLATKLFIPRPRQSLVPRQRLVGRLNECLDHQLTLISAPAGFGKTTLVSTWARGLRQPVAWLSLDEADNDPTRFLSYLVAALQQIDPAIGQDVPAALSASQRPTVDAVIAALINDLVGLPADFVLVLDDFHTLDEATVHRAIQDLVAHQPPQMHLLLVTREDPPLPLARLRARGQLTELRAHDLRFTPEEVAVFLREVMGLALDPRDVSELDARIEGWIAGLQLAALSMQNREHPAELIAALSGSHHFVLSYLTEEVLRQLSPDIQSFLLQTSVLTRLTAPLCDAVTGRADSDALLEQLYTSNAFVIPLDEEHRWYRYHHLFAGLLRSQLHRTQPQMAPTLHVRASAWYELHGLAADALEHAFAAEDFQRAVRLLETHARPVLLQGYAQTVENWLRRLPQEWRVTGPRANLAFAWSLLLRGMPGEIEPYLCNAETAAAERSASGAQLEATGILAETLSLRAALVSLHGDAETGCELAREAVERAPQDDLYLQGMVHFWLGTAYNYAGRVVQAIETYQKALPLCQASGNAIASMLAVANLAMLYTLQGQLHAAASLCRQVLEAAERSAGPRSPALAAVHLSYSDLLYEWGELETASSQAEKWLDLSKRGGHVAAVASGSVVLSRVQQARGDMAGAELALDQAVQMLRHGMPAWVESQVVSQQVALALARGEDAAAWQALAQTGVGLEDATSHTREVVHLAYLRLLHHLGRTTPQATHLHQALELADRLLESAEPAGRMGRVIETLALRALVYQAQGDAGRALEDLSRALALAEPEGYVRLFVNEGVPMAHLLRAAHERGTRPAYIARLLSAFPASYQPSAISPELSAVGAQDSGLGTRHSLVEPLTGRELEVLRLIARGLTYEEVAQQLVVSLNTVRFHVKGVYGKLGVDKRTTAIDRARALGLL